MATVKLNLPTLDDVRSFEIRRGEPHDWILVERAYQMDGSHLWAVRWRGSCLNVSGKSWEREPLPSSRTPFWLKRHRFTSLTDAWQAAKRASKKIPK